MARFLIAPMTAAVIILNFLWARKGFMMFLMLLNRDPSSWTTLFIFGFKSRYGFEESLTITAVLLSPIPIIVISIVLQRYIVEGLTLGLPKPNGGNHKAKPLSFSSFNRLCVC